MTESGKEIWRMACPKCRASDQIDVAATVWIRLCRDGTDVTQAANGDHEWEQGSLAVCQACGYSATVWDFDIENPAGPLGKRRPRRAPLVQLSCNTSPPRVKSSRTAAAKSPT